MLDLFRTVSRVVTTSILLALMGLPSPTLGSDQLEEVSVGLLWQMEFERPDQDGIATWISATSDGGFLLTGMHGQDKVFVSKLGPDGVPVWERIRSLGAAPVICSNVWRGAFEIPGGYVDWHDCAGALVVTRSDYAGTPQWEKRYSCLTPSPRGNAMQYSPARGTLQALGRAGSDVILLEMDLSGDLVTTGLVPPPWLYGPLSGDPIHVPTSDGGSAILARSVSSHLVAFKVDASGFPEWDYEYQAAGGTRFPVGILQTADGGFVLVATTNSWSPFYAAWLLKLDPEGHIEWQKAYYAPDRPIAAVSLIHRGSGGFVLGLNDGLFTRSVGLALTDTGDILSQRAHGGAASFRSYSWTSAPGGCAAAGVAGYGEPSRDAMVLRMDDDLRVLPGCEGSLDPGIAVLQTNAVEQSATPFFSIIDPAGCVEDLTPADLFLPDASVYRCTDTLCADGDGDGYGAPGNPACSGPENDCDDTDPLTFPYAPQLCDGINNDCRDPLYPSAPPDEADDDADGFVECGSGGSGGGDCDDADAQVHPGAVEINDGRDNECAGDPGFGLIDDISGSISFPDGGATGELCWPAQAGATAYQVARSAEADFTGCVIETTGDSCYTDPVVPGPGEVSYYRIRALQPNLGSWGGEPGAEVFLSCGTEACSDGIDDDGDGLTDCLDPDCDGIDGCEYAVELTCDDGYDNDGDGPVDCVDPDCDALSCGPPAANAAWLCGGQACQFQCVADFWDLNGDPADGCEYSCVYQSAVDEPDLAYVDANCDGIDGEWNRAILVSPLGNDGNGGGPADPVRTIQRALGLNAGQPARDQILLDEGTYPESVSLRNGVGIHGGYHFDGGAGWQRLGTLSSIEPTAGTAAVVADGLTQVTVVELVTIRGAAPAAAGGSSYGVLATDSDGLVVRGCTVLAGNGASGADGAAVTGRASDGGAGQLGQAGCTFDPLACFQTCDHPLGGQGGVNPGGLSGACSIAHGGRGGDAGWNGDPGTSGLNAVGGTSAGIGAPAGLGDWNPTSAYRGAHGSNGAPGVAGNPGTSLFDRTGYIHSPGTGGAPGNAGLGGGGGGGGGGGPTVCRNYGGGGGGGGAGGCGGQGGEGGSSGGGSFAIYLWNSDAMLQQVYLAAGQGGNGGHGGSGQAGGLGGSGGRVAGSNKGNPYGGSAQGEGSNGGGGGDGGDGGVGGAGGGGAGGPSIGLLLAGGSTPTVVGVSVVVNPAGTGGSPNGPDGLQVHVLQVP